MTARIAALPLPSEPVLALARAVRASLADHGEPAALPQELFDYARDRHRVLAIVQPRTAPSLPRRSKEWREFVRNEQAQTAVWWQLCQAGLPHLVFKGLPLARQLYPDPAMRHSGDIDVLVQPDDFAGVFTRLSAAGWHASDPFIRPLEAAPPAFQQLLRDVAMRETKSGAKLELHQRLFFSRRLSTQLARWHPELTPRRAQNASDVPAPPIGAGLAHYLLLHGAMSAWARLKWLADIYLLLPRLTAEDSSAVIAAAEAIGTAASLKASLLLVRQVFETELAEPFAHWAGETPGANAVAVRLAGYNAVLSNAAIAADAPMASRLAALRSALRLSQDAAVQLEILLAGPAASAVRLAARLLPQARNISPRSPARPR